MSPKPKKKSPAKSRKKKSTPKRRTLRFLIKWGFILALIGAVLLFGLFGSVYIGLFGPLPSEEALTNIKSDNASEIYSADNKLIGKYFVKNRSSVDFEEIPQVVVDALIATEDSRFFEHEGIDFYSIPRVVIKTVILGDRSGGGGSTISQQLIKNLFGRKDYGALSMPVNKLKENITALKLEEIYTKEEIIELYLNTVSFGEDVYGIKSAAYRYFGKKPSELTVDEAATLIGMLKATTTYNPKLNPEKSRERRNTVMALMVKMGSLDPVEFNKLKSAPTELNYKKLSGNTAPALYLKAFVEGKIKEILKDTQKADGTPYDLYADGLRIELTIHQKLQRYAEEAMLKHMKKLQNTFDKHWSRSKPWGNDDSFLWNEAKKSTRYQAMKNAGKSEAEIKKAFTSPTSLFIYTYDGLEKANMSPLDSIAYHQMILQAGFLAMDARTGQVLAYVGGINYAFFPYDHIRSKRQVGSTFKPFVYGTALEEGFAPCDYVENEPIIFSNYDDWSPENAGGGYGGFYTLKGGLAKSVNTIAARLIAETGPQKVIDFAERCGIESDIPEMPSIALGVAELSLMEMVQAYTPFTQKGKGVKPAFIKAIRNAEGELIYEADEAEPYEAISAETASYLQSMLKLVADSGTARSIHSRYGVRTEVAGKTGTTQNNADGWFMGLSRNIVCGAWVGAQQPTVRFRSTALGQGAVTAMPIVANWFRSVESDREVVSTLGRKFDEPSLDIQIDLVCPLYVESRTENFLENLFTPNEEKRELRRERREKRQEEKEKDEGGWIKKLFNKLKKKKKGKD